VWCLHSNGFDARYGPEKCHMVTLKRCSSEEQRNIQLVKRKNSLWNCLSSRLICPGLSCLNDRASRSNAERISGYFNARLRRGLGHFPIFSNFTYLSNIWSFHGGGYEECSLLGYKNPVRTSPETHYFSATDPILLILCKI
jgi:hypothetical protein